MYLRTAGRPRFWTTNSVDVQVPWHLMSSEGVAPKFRCRWIVGSGNTRETSPQNSTDPYFEGLTFLFVGSNPPKYGSFRYVCKSFVRFDASFYVFYFGAFDHDFVWCREIWNISIPWILWNSYLSGINQFLRNEWKQPCERAGSNTWMKNTKRTPVWGLKQHFQASFLKSLQKHQKFCLDTFLHDFGCKVCQTLPSLLTHLWRIETREHPDLLVPLPPGRFFFFVSGDEVVFQVGRAVERSDLGATRHMLDTFQTLPPTYHGK